MKKILVAVYSQNWEGTDLIKLLQDDDFLIDEAKSADIFFEKLKVNDFDIAIVNQELIGLEDIKEHILQIRDLVPVKSKKQVIFIVRKNVEKYRHELIRENFFDFLVGDFTYEDLKDFINFPRTYDDVKKFLIRTVEKTYEKQKGELKVIDEKLIESKILPNKVVAFYGHTVTTTILNTAIALSKDKDLKILLIDFNTNNHLSYTSLYEKYFSSKCMSEIIESLRKNQLDKNTINNFVVKTNLANNIYLISGFKTYSYMNIFDFDEAIEGKYIESILDFCRKNFNIILVDLPRYFYLGAVLDTVKEADIVYFITTPYFPLRMETKYVTKYMFENIEDMRLIISKSSSVSSINSKMIFNELKDIDEVNEEGKVIDKYNVFNKYIEIPNIDGMKELVEQKKYAYNLNEFELYRESIDILAKDIYYFAGGENTGKNTWNFLKLIKSFKNPFKK